MAQKIKQFVARPLAPEDIRVGAYISVLHVIAERVPGCWCDVDAFQILAARRFVRLPCGNNDPLLVLQVCLPFIFVTRPDGQLHTLDVRRYRFVELDRVYGRRVFNLLRHRHKKTRIASSDNSESDNGDL